MIETFNKITKFSLLVGIFGYTALCDKLIDVYPNFKRQLGNTTNKHVYASTNLPVLIKKYPTLATILTCEAIKQNAFNKEDYIKIYNENFVYSKHSPITVSFVEKNGTNHITCDCVDKGVTRRDFERYPQNVTSQAVPGVDILRYGSVGN